MKKMFILQGAPETGKTSIINRLGVSENTISRDALRDVFSPTVHALDGETRIATTAVEKAITETFNAILDNRLRMGATIFLDGTYAGKKHQGGLVEKAKKHGYTCYLVNMQQGVSLEELLRRNAQRDSKYRVSEHTILHFYEGVENEKNHPDLIPVVVDATEVAERGGTTADAIFRSVHRILMSETMNNTLPPDVADTYDNVIVFGDVHSCSQPLTQALDEFGGINNPRNLYVFVGDLFDRGPDPIGVFNIVGKERDNVIILEGNHEKNLREITNEVNKKPYLQTRETVNKLVGAGVDKRTLKRFCARLRPYLHATISGTSFFITHGGVSPDVYDATMRALMHPGQAPCDREYIYGTSERDKAYRGGTTYRNVDTQLAIPGEGDFKIIQIHGHRNAEHGATRNPIDATPGVYNLEQGIEEGGSLGVAVIDTATGNVEPRYF